MHDQLHIAKKESQFIFFNPFTISRAGLSTPQTEKRAQLLSKRLMECQDAKYVFIPYNPDFHWVLVVIEPRKMIVHYLDPMHHKPCEDLKDIVNMALRISAKKTSKREPSWQLVQCPRQEGGFECGYFVMRFIKEIIFYPTIIASKFGDKKTYSQVEFDEIRGEWATFVLQLIMNHVDAS
ncbi:probable ubiquitin-like-specific protease 2A [Vitis vinifera]|uniref:probable ubiquitin-like-specific protease 2A n=1 Tax=Vitis vinifera TaxID=29760 RepID=UPI0028834B07|nr:probable ubiquitin-like-specific protease 2A [Vitis vinifera]